MSGEAAKVMADLPKLPQNKVRDFVTKYGRKLYESIGARMGPQLLWDLCSAGVITLKDRILIEALQDQSKMINKLLDLMSEADTEKFHGFCSVLLSSNMKFIVEYLLEFHYKSHLYFNSKTKCTEPIPAAKMRAILDHCKIAKTRLMKVPLFGMDQNVYLNLTELYIEPDTYMDIANKKREKVSKKEMLRHKTEREAPTLFRLEGDAGVGKSTLLEEYAYDWCSEMLECEEEGIDKPCQGHNWKLIINTSAKTIETSVDCAIWDSIYGSDQGREILFPMVKQMGSRDEGVAFLLDGVDEVFEPGIRKGIQEYAKSQRKTQTPHLLISSRKGLCCVDGKEFDRKLSLDGFTEEQGLQYIKTYYKRVFSQDNHEVLDYISNHIKMLHWILSNPLRLHIFSELSGHGLLNLDDIKTLTMPKLLKCLEAYVLKYDASKLETEICMDLEGFYEHCLHQLLQNKKDILAKHFPTKTPRMVFLSKRRETDEYGRENHYFLFTHQLLYEHFCSQGVIQFLKSRKDSTQIDALLLFLCNNKYMWNTLTLTCGHLSHYDHNPMDSITFIVQASLILQRPWTEDSELKLAQMLHKMPEYITKVLNAKSFLYGLNEAADPTREIAMTVRSAFSDNCRLIREDGWFASYGEAWIQPVEATEFIMTCIRSCSKLHQMDVWNKTVRRLLPCAYGSPDFKVTYYLPVGRARWVNLVDDKTSLYLNVFSTADIVDALAEFNKFQEDNEMVRIVHNQMSKGKTYQGVLSVRFPNVVELFGEVQDEDFTVSNWARAFEALLKHKPGEYDFMIPDRSIDNLLTAIITSTHPASTATGLSFGGSQVSDSVLYDFSAWCQGSKAEIEIRDCVVILSSDADFIEVILILQQLGRWKWMKGVTFKSPSGDVVEWSKIEWITSILEGVTLDPISFVEILASGEPTITTLVTNWVIESADIYIELAEGTVIDVALTKTEFENMQHAVNQTWVIECSNIDSHIVYRFTDLLSYRNKCCLTFAGEMMRRSYYMKHKRQLVVSDDIELELMVMKARRDDWCHKEYQMWVRDGADIDDDLVCEMRDLPVYVLDYYVHQVETLHDGRHAVNVAWLQSVTDIAGDNITTQRPYVACLELPRIWYERLYCTTKLMLTVHYLGWKEQMLDSLITPLDGSHSQLDRTTVVNHAVKRLSADSKRSDEMEWMEDAECISTMKYINYINGVLSNTDVSDPVTFTVPYEIRNGVELTPEQYKDIYVMVYTALLHCGPSLIPRSTFSKKALKDMNDLGDARS